MSARAYERITDRIVSLLDEGTVPWRRPWTGGRRVGPKSLRSGKAYRGVNRVLLGCAGYDRPEWTTYKQAKATTWEMLKYYASAIKGAKPTRRSV